MSGSPRGSSATQAEGTKEEEGQLKQEEVSFSKSNIREGITSLLCTTGSTPWRYLISPLKMRSSFPCVHAHCSTMFKAFQTLCLSLFPLFFITEVIFVPFFLQEEHVPAWSFFEVMQLNLSEWPHLLVGTISAVLSGTLQPSFAVIFSKTIGVSSFYLCPPFIWFRILKM